MAFQRKSSLAWSNISREDLLDDDKHIWDAFIAAKNALEAHLVLCAQAEGTMQEGDAAKFAYGSIGQGTIGMAVAEPETKAQRKSGFAGLKRPVKGNLADWQNGQDSQGYRR